MDFEHIALQYYKSALKNLEKIKCIKDGTTLFLPKGNEFRILEDIAVEGENIRCNKAYKGNYNPNRRNYPTKLIWMTEDSNKTAEIKATDEIYLVN